MRRTRLEIVEEPTAASHPHPGSALTLLQVPTEPCFHALPLGLCPPPLQSEHSWTSPSRTETSEFNKVNFSCEPKQ